MCIFLCRNAHLVDHIQNFIFDPAVSFCHLLCRLFQREAIQLHTFRVLQKKFQILFRRTKLQLPQQFQCRRHILQCSIPGVKP